MIAEPTDDAVLQDRKPRIVNGKGVVSSVQAVSRPSLTLAATLVPATTLSSQALVTHGVWVVTVWQTANEVPLAGS